MKRLLVSVVACVSASLLNGCIGMEVSDATESLTEVEAAAPVEIDDERLFANVLADGRVRFRSRAGFWATVSPDDGAIALRPLTGDYRGALTFASIGRAGEPPTTPTVTAHHAQGAELQLTRGEVLTEWYRNDTRGLEQGFTLNERLQGEGEVRVALNVTGDLRPRLTADWVDFMVGDGLALSYSGLVVHDADGRELSSSLRVVGQNVVLAFDDEGARYPVVVDPWVAGPIHMPITLEEHKVGLYISAHGRFAQVEGLTPPPLRKKVPASAYRVVSGVVEPGPPYVERAAEPRFHLSVFDDRVGDAAVFIRGGTELTLPARTSASIGRTEGWWPVPRSTTSNSFVVGPASSHGLRGQVGATSTRIAFGDPLPSPGQLSLYTYSDAPFSTARVDLSGAATGSPVTPPAPDPRTAFGQAIAMVNDYLVYAQSGMSVFQRSGSSWTLERSLIGSAVGTSEINREVTRVQVNDAGVVVLGGWHEFAVSELPVVLSTSTVPRVDLGPASLPAGFGYTVDISETHAVASSAVDQYVYALSDLSETIVSPPVAPTMVFGHGRGIGAGDGFVIIGDHLFSSGTAARVGRVHFMFVAGDADGDGLTDDVDPDDDNDGVLDGADSDPLDPDLCRDLDADTCDDCAIGTDDYGLMSDATPNNDGLDTDMDGICDAGDVDDDNDGVTDTADADPLDPDICRDVDMDTCDDCSIGTDDFGPSSDATPNNDGADSDGDGICDAASSGCMNDADCPGTFCVVSAGVCCDTACAGMCEACEMRDTGLADGTCGPVLPGTGGDMDADGVTDNDELCVAMTDPTRPDTDSDGLSDLVETNGGLFVDTDGDSDVDGRDTDSDDDTVRDDDEGGVTDFDGDGTPNFRDEDDDGDGILTATEQADRMLPAAQEDMNGEPAYRDIDADGDGVNDNDECPTRPCVDSDMDSAPDYLDAGTCGNNIQEPGEQCDVGPMNGVPGSGCTIDCMDTPTAFCGDGVVDSGEECDHGAMNGVMWSGCASDCTNASRCGDGVVQPPEECDHGANNGTNVPGPSGLICLSDCTNTISSTCGDGIVDPGEACDLGAMNGAPGSTCSGFCRNVTPSTSWCGDGVVDPGEECDLGMQNGVAGSACTGRCENVVSSSGPCSVSAPGGDRSSPTFALLCFVALVLRRRRA